MSKHNAVIESKLLNNQTVVTAQGVSKADLQKIADEFAKMQFVPAVSSAITRLPNGGIRLYVEIGADLAQSLLETADQAGEAPETFIPRQVEEALLMFTGNN